MISLVVWFDYAFEVLSSYCCLSILKLVARPIIVNPVTGNDSAIVSMRIRSLLWAAAAAEDGILWNEPWKDGDVNPFKVKNMGFPIYV